MRQKKRRRRHHSILVWEKKMKKKKTKKTQEVGDSIFAGLSDDGAEKKESEEGRGEVIY